MLPAPLLHPLKLTTASIGSFHALCTALDITQSELDKARALSPQERYDKRSVPKKDGSERIVFKPHFLIRKIQRRINRRLFANRSLIAWPDHVFGSVPNPLSPASEFDGKDFVNCARKHCSAKSILSMDIKDFFDNVDRGLVINIFSKFLKYPKDVSEALADICCKGSSLVQGGLTSSYVASLCLFEIEGDLVKRLSAKGLVYTRFVDDITISSKISNYDFSFALQQTEQMLHSIGLPVNSSKTRVQYASMTPMLVHGLRVDFDQPRLPPEEPRKIRAAVKNLELLASTPGYRASRSYRKDFNRCMGRVNKLKRVGHSQFLPLIQRLKEILPLASHKDIERAQKLIGRLEKDFLKPGYKDSFWFYKRYFVANERLVILSRSFVHIAKELRQRLKVMHPKRRYE